MVDALDASRQREISIRKARRADLNEVGAVLGRAFDDDPVVNYLVKQDERRSRRVEAMMRLVLAHYSSGMEETYVTEGAEGAAVWTAPSRRPHGLLVDLRALPSLIAAAGLAQIPRALRALDMAEKEHPEEPHYYLAAIGVVPEHQGRGIGSRLMRPVLERADAEGMPAYLESSKEQNLPLYERHGFRVTKELRFPDNGPTVWLMWREPS